MTEDDLLDAVAQAPNDDGPRLVYADWLQQQPDELSRARGEYIALSCTAVRPKPAARLQELLARHELSWLGPIADITDPGHRIWSRGFLDGAATTITAPPHYEAARDHREWCVLRMLETQIFDAETVASLICRPVMKNLKVLQANVGLMTRMTESARAPRIAELAVVTNLGREALVEAIPLLEADCFTLLRRLHMNCAATLLPMLLRFVSPELALIVTTRPRSLQDWMTELAAMKAKLAEVRLSRDNRRMFERRSMEVVIYGAGGLWNHLEVRWFADDDDSAWRDELLAVLRRLPANRVARLSFVGPPSARFDVARFKHRVAAALPGATVD